MKLQQLDSRLMLLGEHCYLTCADECYFVDMYECNQRPGIRPLILSLKRLDHSAIQRTAQELALALPSEWAYNHTFIAIPRSSGTGNALRSIFQLLPPNDFRDLLLQDGETPASHDGWRPSPTQRAGLLSVNELVADPKPTAIVIADDVLTTGAHFCAAKMVLRRKWPEMRVIGLFLSRVCSRKRRCDSKQVGNDRPCVWRCDDYSTQ
jgi:hypothetical protein